MKERNKSKWYIKRLITSTDGCSDPVTEAIYEIRSDKASKEVEVGDTVLILRDEFNITGVVESIELYDDGLFKIAVKVIWSDYRFFTIPSRVGILEEGGKNERE